MNNIILNRYNFKLGIPTSRLQYYNISDVVSTLLFDLILFYLTYLQLKVKINSKKQAEKRPTR